MKDLRCHVGHRSDDPPRRLRLVGEVGDPQIAQLDAIGIANEKVVGLHVSVNYAGLV